MGYEYLPWQEHYELSDLPDIEFENIF